MPIFWWLGKGAYLKFIVRELTSLSVAYAALLLLFQAWFATRGEDRYLQFTEWLQSAPVVSFHVVVLLALIFHTVTWLRLAPKALVIKLGGRRLPDRLVLVGHYAAWGGATAVLLWILLGVA